MTFSATVEMTEATRDSVVRIAQERGATFDAVLSSAVEEYIRDESARERMREDLLESWSEYEETGMHLTGQEVDEWFARRRRGEMVQLPECHR